MKMYNKIYNPCTKKLVGIHTKLGKKILNKYFQQFIEGGGSMNLAQKRVFAPFPSIDEEELSHEEFLESDKLTIDISNYTFRIHYNSFNFEKLNIKHYEFKKFPRFGDIFKKILENDIEKFKNVFKKYYLSVTKLNKETGTNELMLFAFLSMKEKTDKVLTLQFIEKSIDAIEVTGLGTIAYSAIFNFFKGMGIQHICGTDTSGSGTHESLTPNSAIFENIQKGTKKYLKHAYPHGDDCSTIINKDISCDDKDKRYPFPFCLMDQTDRTKLTRELEQRLEQNQISAHGQIINKLEDHALKEMSITELRNHLALINEDDKYKQSLYYQLFSHDFNMLSENCQKLYLIKYIKYIYNGCLQTKELYDLELTRSELECLSSIEIQKLKTILGLETNSDELLYDLEKYFSEESSDNEDSDYDDVDF